MMQFVTGLIIFIVIISICSFVCARKAKNAHHAHAVHSKRFKSSEFAELAHELGENNGLSDPDVQMFGYELTHHILQDLSDETTGSVSADELLKVQNSFRKGM